MGFDNIIEADGLVLAIVGMLVVFAGLLLISVYIAALPRLMDWWDRVQAHREARRRAAHPVQVVEPSIDDEALLTAIGYVIHMEMEKEQVLDTQRITIQRDESQRVWAAAGKMRVLETRM